jgi:hypothetical protein
MLADPIVAMIKVALEERSKGESEKRGAAGVPSAPGAK